MQQHSGFENKFIDVYLCYSNNEKDISNYVPVFNSTDTTILTLFPGFNTVSNSSVYSEKSEKPEANIILPIALLFIVLLLIFLKNILKSSVFSLFLAGLYPKSLQENERRQIERNTLVINSINVVSFFSIALILYILFIRFDFFFSNYKLMNYSEDYFYLVTFFSFIAIVFCYFYSRNGLISFFGNIFSFQKSLKEYQKPFKLLFVSLSPVLFVCAIFIAFSSFSLMRLFVYLFFLIAVFYVFFVALSLIKLTNITNRFSIHIFLYLCTLEVLPLAIMVKLLQSVSF